MRLGGICRRRLHRDGGVGWTTEEVGSPGFFGYEASSIVGLIQSHRVEFPGRY